MEYDDYQVVPQLIQLRTGQFLVGEIRKLDNGLEINQPFEITTIEGDKGPLYQMHPYAAFARERLFFFSPTQVQLQPTALDQNCADHWRRATGRLPGGGDEQLIAG